ncbi:glycosyltransferase family 4 protein [Paucibacter sp. AS339]|uniref:glycosyltransferase family 4 protein n=1 Tax=Paucibacter hankyongi TaxID=3133434 RepID=UPI00309BF315
MRADEKLVVMIGPGLDAKGGMSAVVQSYKSAGLFERANVAYLSSFRAHKFLTQLRCFGGTLRRLLWLLLRGRVALVHLHSAARGSLWRKSVLAFCAGLFRVPYLFHIHSGEFANYYADECGSLRKWWARRVLERATQVIVLTEGWERQLRTLLPQLKLLVLANPVEVPATVGMQRAAVPTILFLSRVRKKKGIFDLLKAMVQVREALPRARLLVAGDGHLEEVAKQAEELGLSSAIELLGWVDGAAKARAIAACDTLVLPSYFEGLPVCILEAMAAGKLVVASRVGGIPDIVKHEINGLLVEPGQVEALAQVLLRSLTDEVARQRMIALARLDVAAMDVPVVVAKLSAVYEDLRHAA